MGVRSAWGLVARMDPWAMPVKTRHVLEVPKAEEQGGSESAPTGPALNSSADWGALCGKTSRELLRQKTLALFSPAKMAA